MSFYDNSAVLHAHLVIPVQHIQLFSLLQTSPFVSAVEARLRDLLNNYMNADSALVIDGKVSM